MLKRLTFIIMFLFLFVGIATPYEVPRTVLLTEEFKSHYRDADKTYDGDDMLCWAAVMSNMLAFITDGDEDEWFDWYKERVENKGNTYLYGMTVFCEEYVKENDKNLCTAFVNMDYVNFYRTGDMRSWIVGTLIKSEIIGLGARSLLFGGWHAITVYGYTLDEEDRFYLYWTDSSDGKRMMYKDRVSLAPNGVLMFSTGTLMAYTIYEAISLSIYGATAALEMNKDTLDYFYEELANTYEYTEEEQ